MANRYTYHLPGAIFIITRNTGEFFRVTFSVSETRQNKAPLHCMKSLRYRCFILWPRSSKRRIGNKEVCKPTCRDCKPNKSNAKTRCTNQSNRQADCKVYHICNKKRPHDSKSAKNAISCHLDAHEDEKVTKPSHIITGHLIGQRGSIFSQEQRGNLRVQCFNDHESKNCKA